MSRAHWLCIAYAFPPINRSGTHRTLGFVKHLDRFGWDATVLTVEPRDEPLDESLPSEIPASTMVIRVPWVDAIERIKTIVDWRLGIGDWWFARTHSTASNPQSAIPNPQSYSPGVRDWVSRVLITPDSRLGWIAPAVRAGLRAIRRRRPDVIYSTSPYMSAHLIALILSRWARLPWVADFRDPWRGNPFSDLTHWSLAKWDAWLEGLVLCNAAHIVCNTPTLTQLLCRRRPFVVGKCTTILNGFDPPPGGFDGLKPIRIAPGDDFVLTHCGQFYGPRSPKEWFAAVRRALDRSPELAGRIHVALIGYESYEGRPLRDWATDVGIGERVHVLGRKSHGETLSYMAGSDALMLAGSGGVGGELQIPSKLYEYLAARRPIIAACSGESPIVEILKDAHAEALVCDPGDEQALADAITRLALHRHVDIQDAWKGVSRFDRVHRTAELLEVFRCVNRRHGLACRAV